MKGGRGPPDLQAELLLDDGDQHHRVHRVPERGAGGRGVADLLGGELGEYGGEAVNQAHASVTLHRRVQHVEERWTPEGKLLSRQHETWLGRFAREIGQERAQRSIALGRLKIEGESRHVEVIVQELRHRCSMCLLNARQLITQCSTRIAASVQRPLRTAILPKGPYLSRYDTISRNVSASRR